MRFTFHTAVATLVVAFALVGCGQIFRVSVNSFTTPAAKSKSYFVLSGMKGVPETDLQFAEARGCLSRVMNTRGFVQAPTLRDAHVAVMMNYGIGEPEQSQFTSTSPVFGLSGGGTSEFETSTRTSSGTLRTTGTITEAQTFGITGYQTVTKTVTAFDRWVFIRAIDLDEYRATGAIRSVWETTIVSTGRSGDLRRVLPVMIAAAGPKLDENTGRFVDISLREGDARVKTAQGL